MSQLLMLPDPRPLDERLGAEFFRNAPKCAGVYLMRDAADKILYVGKAKNLQQRLRNYRIANPDRMPRRHLRMVRQVVRIELQFCEDESAALRHESKLLRALKPKFNRAGVWQGKTRFVAWRPLGEQLELSLVEVPEIGWRRFGPLNGVAIELHQTLARMLWLAVHPGQSLAEMPLGWARNKIAESAVIGCGATMAQVMTVIDAFFWEAPEYFIAWLDEKLSARLHPFERAVIVGDLARLEKFAMKNKGMDKHQLALL